MIDDKKGFALFSAGETEQWKLEHLRWHRGRGVRGQCFGRRPALRLGDRLLGFLCHGAAICHDTGGWKFGVLKFRSPGVQGCYLTRFG